MRSKSVRIIAVTLLSIALLGILVPCCVNADETQTEPGDPYSSPPGSKSLDPTPGTLGDFWMILMAMAFQLAL
jgi:hypothetical protein